jgi:hypothetical protein
MSALSTAKVAAILAKVQLNPEILTDHQAFVESRIDAAAEFLVDAVGLRRYPELVQGYSQSAASPSEDITGLATSELLISVDGELWHTLEVPLAGLNSGASIASALQTEIRDIDKGAYKFTTVTFASGVYTITSPTYGEESSVYVEQPIDYEELAQALGLSPIYGGIEIEGGEYLPLWDDMVVRLVQHWFNQIGVEGMKSQSVPGSGSYTEHDIDPIVHRFIVDNRRLVR